MVPTEASHPKERNEHKRSGPSSYHRHDHNLIFSKLCLKPGQAFLDLGSGRGDFAVHASKLVGQEGSVYALEKNEHYAETLLKYADDEGLNNLISMAGDMTAPLLLADNCIDVCLACTSMHFLDLPTQGRPLFHEIQRILKPGGMFGVVECSKENLEFGPPENMRNDPEEYEPIIRDTGFIKTEYIPLGFLYMLLLQTPIENINLPRPQVDYP